MGHEVQVQGRKLKCPFCGGEHFSKRSSLLNTRWLTFFEWDFFNKSADNYICDNCGHIMWFMPK